MSDPITHDGHALLAILLVMARNLEHLSPRGALKSLGAAGLARVDAQVGSLLVTPAQLSLNEGTAQSARTSAPWLIQESDHGLGAVMHVVGLEVHSVVFDRNARATPIGSDDWQLERHTLPLRGHDQQAVKRVLGTPPLSEPAAEDLDTTSAKLSLTLSGILVAAA
jgi:hypothetical protein